MSFRVHNINIEDFELFKMNEYTPFENAGRIFLLNREPYLDIVLTDFCNTSCGFCIANLIHNKLKLNFEKAKPKVEFAVRNMHVKDVLLLGGEPTVSPILIKFITFLKTLPLQKIIMTTNGINLARNAKFREKLFSAGLTNLNISVMNLDPAKQAKITGNEHPLCKDEVKLIVSEAHQHNIKVRINVNIFKGNYDNEFDMVNLWQELSTVGADSVKFSPLLKTDAFSVIEATNQWVKDHILSDTKYDELFSKLENMFTLRGICVIRNKELFGFVQNSMIPVSPPIIINWNQHGQMMKKVIEENKINNLKLLPNNELSLSWNRKLAEYFIKTD